MAMMTELKKTGLGQEWLHDKRIAVLTIQDTSMETLDAWATTSKNLITHWPAEQPYLILHDYSKVDLLISSYIRRKSEEISQLRPELHGKVAVMFKRTIAAQIAQVALNAIWNKGYQARQRKVFFTRDDALKWLLE